jgi:hypothetical protein
MTAGSVSSQSTVSQVAAGPDKSAKMISKTGKMQPTRRYRYLMRAVQKAVNPLFKLAYVERQTGDPNGIRTRVTAVKGRCPRPLDDRVFRGERNMAVTKGRAREMYKGAPTQEAVRW